MRGKRIVLLIAHPDDEAMFFGPTLTHLTAPELGNHVKVLCLSTGNAESIGGVRRKELQTSALHLGVRRPADIFIVDDQERFPDSMTKTWSATEIAGLLIEAFAPEIGKAKSSASGKREETQPPKATIDVLITFDKQGVSNHPNHISLSHGAELFIRLLMRDKSGWRCPVSLYHLRSINIFRKYSFLLDAPYTLFTSALKVIVSGSARKAALARGRTPVRDIGTEAKSLAGDPVEDNNLIFIANPGEYWKIREAMTTCHKSQMVWFRWGWITLGRYMVVNELSKE
ncbi:putative n-acetylglucosaminyl-phosphatidylinositol [Phaeomoniella chlamydospora]|uniref:N-acetylglucosaminylphosphatidylinositol deacetylase n=1 Tax=Phaeomoniella chlamydospora TaxID=158046 RepID=A0A0G2EZF3_PHACM|nr:putative n-acetylglucosaminyl-phosphatidylinositol [Phaeomoniella chlamydospora]